MAHGVGRDRNKETFWRRMVRGQAGSGLTVRDWCARHNLAEASFYWWRRQLTRRDAAAMTLVPVCVTADRPAMDAGDTGPGNGSPGQLEIVLSQGHRVRVVGPVDRQALVDVLAALTSAPCVDAESRAC